MASSDSEEEDTNKSLDEEEIHRIQQIKTHCKGLPDEKKRIQRMLDELDADMLERRTAVKRRLKQKRKAEREAMKLKQKRRKKDGSDSDDGSDGDDGDADAVAAGNGKVRQSRWMKRCVKEPREVWDTLHDACEVLRVAEAYGYPLAKDYPPGAPPRENMLPI